MNRATFQTSLRLQKKKSKRLPRQVEPNHIRAAYLKRLLNGPWATLMRIIKERLDKATLQRLAGESAELLSRVKVDADGDVSDLFDGIEEEFYREWPRDRMGNLVRPVAGDLQKFNAGQLNKALSSVLGVDVVGNEPWLTSIITSFTNENVSLIRGATSDFLSDVEKKLAQGLSDGVRWESLAKTIAEREEVSEKRAALIARDQAGKFYGDLNKARQENLGVKGYVWRTVNDNRVREEHEVREGKSFLWSDPPEDGHPGEAINCRCYAEPDLSEFLE